MTDDRRAIALLSLLLIAAALVYLPGIHGPFVFDDYTNVVNNDFVKVHKLNADQLYHAAYSLKAGPLQRPIPMLSFALNYYFAGSFADPTPYKLTNLIIHMVNGLLVLWLARLTFRRWAMLDAHAHQNGNSFGQSDTLLAAGVALLWIVHPVQLTSVLYVVQRMAQLSASFTLLALICYVQARTRMLSDRRGSAWLLLGFIGFGVLGVLSKENAVLLLLFAALLEFTLYAKEWPWHLWGRIPPLGQRTLVATGLVTTALVAAWALNYALPGYLHRPFTLGERLMTEFRVLMFYLSLILLPRISAFGLQHDDIALSTSLWHPWTTSVSLLGLAALMLLALAARRRHPMLTLGILWFFTAHLLESTIFSLEIAHEHRNYLASLGPIIAVVYLLELSCRSLGNRRVLAFLPLMALFLAGTTTLRAYEWSDLNTLRRYEALHHPNSARAQDALGSMLFAQGHYNQAREAVRRASELDPKETGYLMTLVLMAVRTGAPISEELNQRIIALLRDRNKTTLTDILLQNIGECIQTTCAALQGPMENWITTIIASRPKLDNSFYYNLLGRTLVGQGSMTEAIQAFRRSFQEDPTYLHPLFELANLYIYLGQIDRASEVLRQLQRANKTNLHPRNRETEHLALTIDSLRKSTHTVP